ncbi:MAG: sigma-E factor regulatory protein RseB domain-containing protein [Actinomycetota bacterium]
MARLPRSRSAIASVVLALVLGTSFGVAVTRADPVPDLPPIAPERLIANALVAIASRTPVSGTVTTHLDLGLPQLPASLGSSGGAASILLADQTFKVWRSPDGTRIAQILPFAERDLIATRTDVWAWDSSAFTAWHAAVPLSAEPPAPPSVGDIESIATKVLAEAAKYATLSLAEPERVAGRGAYVLALEPIDPTTLVGSIRVAIDAETWLPLRVQVIPKGSVDAAIEAGFTSVDFGPVDPSIFTFTPPDGATVKELGPASGGSSDCGGDCGSGVVPDVRTFGDGFGLILAVRVPAADVPPDARAMLPYAGPLGSVDLVVRGDHAWVLAGAVDPSALQAVEPELP